jgi:flagellar hook protein FlgE
MGIYGALSTAVSGLRAQAFALENISGNIANSQTTGYKRMETDFVDLIPDAPLKRQVPGAVIANSRSTNNVTGDIKTASTDTYMAINGSGFFVVEPRIGYADGDAVFGGVNFYTRRGDFELDKGGYLVNGAGNYLKGLPIDSTTGNVSGAVPEVIRVTNAFLAAQPTTRIDYRLNLPQIPMNGGYQPAVANSELLNPLAYSPGGDPTVAGDGVVLADDNDRFILNSINGGATTVYAPNGAPVDLQLRWAKVDSEAAGGSDTWNLFYLSDSGATGVEPMWTNVGVDYVFNGSGNLDPDIVTTALTGLTVNGVALGNLDLDHGTSGVSQFADPQGTAEVAELSQNGYSAGEYLSVAVNDGGRVVATYSNGQQVELAQVVIADFNAVNQLQHLDGGLFGATSESGEAILSSGVGIIGSALEASNTDISEEFTKLIVTQQAYAAGTRIVSTSDEMLQEALNMVR